METKPTTWQEQGLFTSLVEMQGEEGASVGHSVPLRERKAPKAMPEEDLEAPELGVRLEAPRERQTTKIIEIVDVIKIENRKSTDIIQRPMRETREDVTELEGRPKKFSDTQEEPKEADNFCEKDFPPPLLLRALSAAECGEKEGASSLEGEVGEWISEAEPNEVTQECAETPKLLEPAHGDADIRSWLNSTALMNAGDIRSNKTGTSGSQSARRCLSDMSSSDDRDTLNSPPFADESEEEEGTGGDVTTCQHRSAAREMSCMGFQPSCSNLEETDSALPADDSVRQEEAVLPQSQSQLCPRRLNQEAAQQVFGQGSPPGSAVAMELANQGGEASQGHSCVAAARERSSRVGERTEGENEQTGGVKGQNKSRVEKSRTAVRSQSRGLFRYLQAVQTQEPKAENSCGISPTANRDTRMRSDTYDDSQSDSGVSADFHSYRTLDSSTSMSTDSPGPVSSETPIEREIRRAIEREQSLRRSRGLPNQRTSPEYVEVPSRKSLSMSSTPKWSQNKDREFAGKKMQHEIHEETRREQDLVKIGKIPGFYDKGTVRQIKERKQLFETLQVCPESPLTFSPKSKTPSWSSGSSEDLNLILESQDESGTSTPEHTTYKERKPTTVNASQNQTSAKGLDRSGLRGPKLSEGTGCQIIIIENSRTIPAQKHYKAKAEAKASPALETGKDFNSTEKTRSYDGLVKAKKEQEAKEMSPSKGNPFFKLRSSANLDKVRQDIQEAKDRENELHTLRLSLYGGINGAESPSKNEIPAPSPLPNGNSGLDEGRQTVDQVSVPPPGQSEEEKIFHTEVRKSPRTPRQKNPLVQLWESGLINNYNLEDE
ncbi:mitotic interactor and substrate of PLK1-like [Poecilia latipinna]|uniref:mitotic interactor and substrate of PLK1-like n=1 Tax=Poecilia latipinna TaxID=48699 RepID=UPI00072E61C5|nr:PREDICTED: mitotic interactor and substrate of PLK1-like [Poecilia latipinna]